MILFYPLPNLFLKNKNLSSLACILKLSMESPCGMEQELRNSSRMAQAALKSLPVLPQGKSVQVQQRVLFITAVPN